MTCKWFYCAFILVQTLINGWLTHPSNKLVCVDLMYQWINTLRPRQNGRHFADDLFKCSFLNENVWISIKIPLKFNRKGPINNIPSLVRMMAWRPPDDKPLCEPMMVSLLTHMCVTQPQWVKILAQSTFSTVRIFRWHSARLQHLQCINNGGTAIVHKAIDLTYETWHLVMVLSRHGPWFLNWTTFFTSN